MSYYPVELLFPVPSRAVYDLAVPCFQILRDLQVDVAESNAP